MGERVLQNLLLRKDKVTGVFSKKKSINFFKLYFCTLSLFVLFPIQSNIAYSDTFAGEVQVEYIPNAEEEKVEYRFLKSKDSKLPQTGEQKVQLEPIVFCIMLMYVLIYIRENEEDLK